jgi:hypothetical protein
MTNTNEPNANEPVNEPNVREAISDISSRLSNYGQLSASLVQEGWMAAPKQTPLMSVLGVGGFYKVARWVPLLRQVNQVLITVGAVRFALNEMQPENANRHLHNAGLTREQVEADFYTISTITQRYTTDSAKVAGEMANQGIQSAGRAAGKGFKAFNKWRKNWLSEEN